MLFCKICLILFVALVSILFIIQGVLIRNVGEMFIGAMVMLFAWFMFTDREYGKSVKEIIKK